MFNAPKVQVGKTYELVAGVKRTIVKHIPQNAYPFIDNYGCGYKEDGESQMGLYTDIKREVK